MDYDKGTQWNYGSTAERKTIHDLKTAYDQKNILPILQNNFKPKQALRVLEFGPGSGTLAEVLHQHFAEIQYTTLDCDPICLERIKSNFPMAQTITAKNYAEFETATSSDKYDAIIWIDVWEHLDKKNLLQYTSHCHKLLLHGGIFIAQVPNIACPLAINTIFSGDITHQNMFNEISAKQLLIMSGFNQDAISVLPFKFPKINMLWKIREYMRTAYFVYVKAIMLLIGVIRVDILTPNLIMVGKKHLKDKENDQHN